MVAIDAGIALPGHGASFNSKSLIALAAGATIVLAAGVLAWNGLDDNGLRAASAIATRFASFVFFASIIAGPLCRLFPAKPFRAYGAIRRDLLLAFCASYGVYIFTIVAPHLLLNEGLTMGMALFAVFSGAILAMMAGASTGWFATHLGRPAQRAILAVAAIYFWLIFTLVGLAHLNGPHRPDGYYGFCLLLMVAAVLLRFADSFVIHLKTPPTAAVTSQPMTGL
ncbi:MAG TPA: hypothetical protein VIJ72_01650 [Rhizomicrobium sp.]